MPIYDVAHSGEQGQEIIIVPMARSFGHLTSSQQAEQTAVLQECATSAGLRGGWQETNDKVPRGRKPASQDEESQCTWQHDSSTPEAVCRSATNNV